MAYAVSISSRAQRDLADLYEEINVAFSDAALKWYRGLKLAIMSLEVHPNRCSLIRKRDKLRQLLYGRKPNVYRVIYRIQENRSRLKYSTFATVLDGG